jgi:cytochrome c-type biogenesis protein CcmI
MVWFWIGAGFLTLAALATLLRPLVHRPRPGSGDEEAVAALFRRQLAETDAELALGGFRPTRPL